MTIKSFNAQDGISVGQPAIEVVDSSGNFINANSSSTFNRIVANTFVGNAIASNIAANTISANTIASPIHSGNAFVGNYITGNIVTANTASVQNVTVNSNLTVKGTLIAPTFDDPFVTNSAVITASYLRLVNDWHSGTIPFSNVTSGFYSFASGGTGLTVSYTTTGNAITAITAINNGGTLYYTGDLVTVYGGLYDSVLRVTSQVGGRVTGLEIINGGQGYANVTAATTIIPGPAASTYTLAGVLTGPVTLVMPSGPDTEAANEWYIVNNTTNSGNNEFGVTIKLSNGIGGVFGRGVTATRGIQNSRITLIQTDGQTDIYSVNGQTYIAYTDVTTTNSEVLIANFDPPFYELTDGLTVGVGAAVINRTASPTLNVNGLGAFPIVKGTNSPLLVGDIGGADHEMLLTFNLGTHNWVLQNPIYGVGSIGIQYKDVDDYQYFTLVNIAGTFISEISNTPGFPFGEMIFQSPDGTFANATAYGNVSAFYSGNANVRIENSAFKANNVSLALNIWSIGGNVYGNTSGAHARIQSSYPIQSSDTLFVEYDIPYQAVIDGLTVGMGAQYINETATPTLEVDGLGIFPITKGANHPLVPGDIAGPNHEMLMTYNSGLMSWVLQNPTFGVGTIGVQYTDALGTSDQLTMNFPIPYRVLIDGLTIGGGAQYINQTATPTLNVDGLGAFPIVKGTNSPLLVGDIGGADHEMLLTFNLGTHNWVLQNPIYGVGSIGIQYKDVDDYQYFIANLTVHGTGANTGGFNLEYGVGTATVDGERVFQSPDNTWANAKVFGTIDTIVATPQGNLLTIIDSTFKSNNVTGVLGMWDLGRPIIGNVTGARANLYSFNSTMTTDTLHTEYVIPYKALLDGLTIGMGAKYVNTTPNPTLNVDYFGAFPIVKGTNSPLIVGDIGGADHEMLMTFNLGTQTWVLQNPIFGVGTIGVQYTDALGTSDALTMNFAIPYKDLFDGLTIGGGAKFINLTATPTLNVDGHGAFPIVKGTNNPLLVGDIGGANHEMLLTWNGGTQTWVLQNPTFGVGTIGVQYKDTDDYQYFAGNLTHIGTGGNVGGFNTEYTYIDATGTTITVPGEVVYQSPDGTWANATAHGLATNITTTAGQVLIELEDSRVGNTPNGASNLLNIWQTGKNIIGNVSGATANLYALNQTMTTDTLFIEYPIPYKQLFDGLTIGSGAQYVNETATPTLVVDGQSPPATITKGTNSPLIPGDIGGPNHEMLLTYNKGTNNWVLQNPIFGVGTNGVQYIDALDRGPGLSDQLIFDYAIPYKALFDGLTIGGGSPYANKTANVTMNVDGHGAVPLMRNTNLPLLPGDIGGPNHELLFSYNAGTNNWVLQNPMNFYGPNANVFSGTTSTSTTTGALTVTGGAGITGNINAGGALTVGSAATVNGAATINSTLAVSGATTAAGITASGPIITNSTTDSTGTNSGALLVRGGIGIAKSGYIGGDFHVLGNLYAVNTISTSVTTSTVQNTLVFLGESTPFPYNFDVGIYSQAQDPLDGNRIQYFGLVRNHTNDYWVFYSNANIAPTANTTVNFTEANIIYDTIQAGGLLLQNTTVSTSTTSGALTVAGGLGIGGNINATAIYSDNYKFANGVAYVTSTFLASPDIISNATSGFNTTFSLTSTGITAGTYGSATTIPALQVDSKGRVTAISTALVSTTFGLSGTTGLGSVSTPAGSLIFASTNGLTASVARSIVTLDTPQDLRITASPTFANLTVSNILQAAFLEIGTGTSTGTSTLAGTTVLANGVRVYTASATDGNNLYADLRFNSSTGTLAISSKSGALYLNYDGGHGAGVVFGNGNNGTVGTVDASGNANFLGAITQGGSQVLTAANFNTYVPSLTGVGAGGTWNISVTGSSAASPAGALTGPTLAPTVVTSSLTTVGTLGNLTVSGPTLHIGAVNAAAGINASTISAATIGNVGAVFNGTINTAAQPNITSLGTLSGLAVTGTLTQTGSITVTGSITGASIVSNTSISATSATLSTLLVLSSSTHAGGIITSAINAATIGNTGAVLTGTVSTAAQPNITTIGTLGNLIVSGNIISGNITVANGSFTTLSVTSLSVISNILGNVSITGTASASNATSSSQLVTLSQLDQTGLYKLDSTTPVFFKTGASTISIKAGSTVLCLGTIKSFNSDTAIIMPALVAGTDYAIYICTDGTIRADSNYTAPVGYTIATSRKIGGFHYGLVAPGTTIASGSFATTGNGKIWTQGNVDTIAGINTYSIWDLKFRPTCDPRGMALVGNQVWVDIYLCSTNTAVNGTSKAGTNIASGTVLPIIPTTFNGNGTTTYPTMNWWVANELVRANGKRMLWEHEFVDAAFGVTENQSIDAVASTYPNTQRNVGYTSQYGIEQASGHHWIWGLDSNFWYDTTTASWKDVNGNTGAAGAGRGQIYTEGTYGLTRVLLGGTRAFGAFSGSRTANWSNYPWVSDWNRGVRAACDHLQLV